jgi:hypothetical protein
MLLPILVKIEKLKMSWIYNGSCHIYKHQILMKNHKNITLEINICIKVYFCIQIVKSNCIKNDIWRYY